MAAEAFVASLLDLATRAHLRYTPAPSAARVSYQAGSLGLYTGHVEPLARWTRLHHLPTQPSFAKRPKTTDAPAPTRELPQLPPEVRRKRSRVG